MKITISILTNLITSSTLFWAVPTVEGQEVNLSIAAKMTSYCHIKFPLIREDSLFTGNPVLHESAGNSIDLYGSCDRDPLGRDEIRAERELLKRGYFADGD